MLRSLCRRLFTPSRRPTRRRLELEPLEDRLVLSTFLVTNASDNLAPGSLRYAISQANMAGNQGSTVDITSQVVGPINLINGELSITSDMTIRNDSGAALEVHQSTANARLFEIGPSATDVTITGVGAGSALTLDGGSVSGANGGGILVDGDSSTLTLGYVNILSNSASTVSGAGGYGGGIYSPGQVVLDHSALGTLAAPNSAASQGGGVWAGLGLTLTASSIVGNQAGSDGGGVVVNDGNVSLDDGSSVSYNQSPNGMGGGIDVAVGSVIVTNDSHVDGNSARDVGGILVGAVAQSGTDAVDVTAGSTVNGNSSTALLSVSSGDFGGGGIATPTTGNVTISASQVSNNHSVGMYSGGIVVGLGSVTVMDGSQIDGNTNNGPGGGIAANFGGVITVTGGSQVDGNTGAAIGGGIVNFAGPLGGVVISNGSQVNNNVLTNAETLQQALGVFLQVVASNGSLSQFASSAGGSGGAGLQAALQQTATTAGPLARQLQAVVNLLAPGPLVTGGGIGTLLAPITVSGSSEVNGNLSGMRVQGGPGNSVGIGGGLFSVFGAITVNRGAVSGNQALQGDGGGIYNAFGSVNVLGAFLDNNISLGNGGAIYNAYGSVYVLYSILDNNFALGNGGGIYNAFGSVNVQYSILEGNLALGDGGGFYNAFGSAGFLGAYLGNNLALGNGGGMWNDGGLILASTILASNGAGNDGGGLFNAPGASAFLSDSAFLFNAANQNGGAFLNLGDLQAVDVTYFDNMPST